jgi:hypothetical protein
VPVAACLLFVLVLEAGDAPLVIVQGGSACAQGDQCGQ